MRLIHLVGTIALHAIDEALTLHIRGNAIEEEIPKEIRRKM